MEINAALIKACRTEKNWTQQHLAEACGLSLRTIQRVERYGNASNETVSALASVFEIEAKTIMAPELKPEIIELMNVENISPSPWPERISLILVSMCIGYLIATYTS